jgi:pilus assembly protein CpaE
MRKLIAAFTGRKRGESGAAAVEFALFAPTLVFALLTAVDCGSALQQRLTMDQLLRSGAQVAMTDPGEQTVTSALQSTASKNFSAAPGDLATGTPSWKLTYNVNSDPLSLSVSRYCTCPDNLNATVACSTTCPGTTPTYIYYHLGASKRFSGIVMPAFSLSSRAEVQVR